jgi:hypothetical protein
VVLLPAALMNNKDTILIVYPPGGYGTFVEWCLTYFSSEISTITLPFTTNGSSHLFAGNPLDFFVDQKNFPNFVSMTTEEYFSSNINYAFARTHGQLDILGELPGYNIKSYIDHVRHNVKKIVLLTVPENAQLLVLGNSITKTKMATKRLGDFSSRVVKEFKDQFQVSDTTNVPAWQLREMISYWHERRLTELHANRYTEITDSKIINISIRDLVDNFEHTIVYLFNALSIPIHNVNQLLSIRQHWLSLQKFIDSDEVCQQIINSVLDGTELSWRPLHIIEQAFVQWQLRDLHQLDMLCYNLDEFPLTTSGLKKVLINV